MACDKTIVLDPRCDEFKEHMPVIFLLRRKGGIRCIHFAFRRPESTAVDSKLLTPEAAGEKKIKV
jgi:hypothetical protein